MKEALLDWPVRPSLPPLLWCALGLWASAAVVYSCAEGLARSFCVLLAGAGAVATVPALVLLWRRKRVVFASLLLGIALGVVCAGAGAASLHAAMDEVDGDGRSSWRFEVLEDATAGAYGAQCYARATAEDGRTVTARVSFSNDEFLPLYGDVFEAETKLERPSGSSSSFCWQHGAAAVAQVDCAEPLDRGGLVALLVGFRTQAVETLAEAGGEAGVLLQALVCGARGDLSSSTLYADFKATGLAHIVAVSGSHLVIVSGFVLVILRALRAPRFLQIALQGLFLAAYLVFSGAPVSAVRAAIMAIVGMSSFFASRRPSSLNALALCIVVLIGVSPCTAVSVSFALSAGSTLGIVLFSRLLAAWLDALPFRMPRFLRDALALTFASGITTVPASAALFAQTSLVSPLANAVASPLFALACTSGLVAAMVSAFAPCLGGVVVNLAGLSAQLLIGAVHAFARVPYASIPASLPFVPILAVSVVAALLLWWFWPKPSKRLLFASCGICSVLLCCGIVACASVPSNQIIMLDVGQGDAFLVRSEGRTLLIDTGTRDQALREALARHGVFRLDAVLITHGDDDHMGSLSSLRGVVGVDSVFVAQETFSCGCSSCERLCADAESLVGEDGVCGLQVGDVLECGAFALTVVWPYAFEDEGGNADSVCLLGTADIDHDGLCDWSALFCGDVEAEQLASLIEEGVVSHVDIYKVGHHGSRVALDDEVAEALSPLVALVSVGAGNRYGHPTSETLERLDAVGAQVFRTDEQGDVSCELSTDSIEVTTLR